MGWWVLPILASSFWGGILLSGLSERGVGTEVSWALLAIGWLGLAAVSLAARSNRLHKVVLRLVSIATCFVLLGAAWEGLHQARISGSPLLESTENVIRIRGTLSTDPQQQAVGWTATLRVGLAILSSSWRPPSGSADAVRVHDTLWLEGRGRVPQLVAGDRVEAVGSISLPRGSFGSYLRHRGYSGALLADQVIPRGASSNPLLRVAGALRSALRRSVRQVLPPRHAGLLMGLALGDTSQLDPDIEESFRATGLSHLTAVSGENVAMFLAPVLGLLMLLRLGPRARFVVGMAAVGFFVLLTRAEPSVLRAAVMSGLAMLGIFLGRPRSPPAILGGAVLLLLSLDPALVYAIGFQLSVAATAGMALLAEPVALRLRFFPRALALAAGTTIGAQAGVTPLLLYHFGVVPTVTILANLLAFPSVGPGMLLGLAAAACGLVVRPLGLLLALLARIPLAYLEGVAGRLARSPFPSVTSSAGHWLTLLAGLLSVGVAGWWLRSGRVLPRRALLAAALVLPVVLWTGGVRAGAPSTLTATFFDVGQGDAALIRSPGGAAILIDGGPDPQLVAKKLASLGVRRLDLLVATHPHADHVGGLPSVLARFRVALAVDPGCEGDSPFFQAFLRSVRASGVPFRHPGVGTVLRVGDVTIQVLGPEHCFVGTNSDPNNDSLVLRVVYGTASILFPGDAEEPSQSDLLRAEAALLTAVVLKVPHHGGATSLGAFFQDVHARIAIVSVGPNRYGHPVPKVLAELERDGMTVFRTDRYGDVTVTFPDGGIVVSTSHGQGPP